MHFKRVYNCIRRLVTHRTRSPIYSEMQSPCIIDKCLSSVNQFNFNHNLIIRALALNQLLVATVAWMMAFTIDLPVCLDGGDLQKKRMTLQL